MFKFGLKNVIVLLGIVFSVGLFQITATAEVQPTDIDIPDKGFAIVLRAPTSESYQLVKFSKGRNGKIQPKILQGFTVSLPKNTQVHFGVDQVNTVLYDVKIIVEGVPPQAEVESGKLDIDSAINSIKKAQTIISKSSTAEKAGAQGAAAEKTDNTGAGGAAAAEAETKDAANDTGSQGAAAAEDASAEKTDEAAAGGAAAAEAEKQDVSKNSPKTQKTEADKDKALDKKNALDTLKDLEDKMGAIKNLYLKLNEVLYETEKPVFYNEPVENFKKVKTKAKNHVKNILKMPTGTSQEIRNDAIKTLKKVQDACTKVEKESFKDFPKDLSQTSHPIVAVFVKTVDKLHEIETADWVKKDTQDRLLRDQIKYTCVFRLREEHTPKEENINLKGTPPRVVTIIQTTNLSGIKATVGPFISNVRDDNYVKINGKIGLGTQDQFSTSFGVLGHLPLLSRNIGNFSGALALSSGLTLGKISTIDGNLALGPIPVTLGGSILLSAPTSNSLLSLTGGAILRPVNRLNDYHVGDTYPSDPQTLTTRVNKFGWFFAVTFSYPLFEQLDFKSAIGGEK